jgi:hypothetical protein
MRSQIIVITVIYPECAALMWRCKRYNRRKTHVALLTCFPLEGVEIRAWRHFGASATLGFDKPRRKR